MNNIFRQTDCTALRNNSRMSSTHLGIIYFVKLIAQHFEITNNCIVRRHYYTVHSRQVLDKLSRPLQSENRTKQTLPNFVHTLLSNFKYVVASSMNNIFRQTDCTALRNN
jgi:hypothetical protein